MNTLNVATCASKALWWFVLTLFYAVLAPWLLVGCLVCFASFLPHDVWSFRDMVMQAAFANSDAWNSGAVTWYAFAKICFVGVCVARVLFSPAVRDIGRWFSAKTSEWIDTRFSDSQQRRIGRIALPSLLGACIVLGFTANKMERESRVPAIERPTLDAAPPATAAAIRLPTGDIVSGDAEVAAVPESGAFLVRFKDQEVGRQ